jgi:hypothetical protein
MLYDPRIRHRIQIGMFRAIRFFGLSTRIGYTGWQPVYPTLLRMIPEKRRTSKMMRVLQTREKSGRSHTCVRKSWKRLRVKRWIYLLSFWRWRDSHRLTTRRQKRTCLDYCLINFVQNDFQHGHKMFNTLRFLTTTSRTVLTDYVYWRWHKIDQQDS